MKHKAPSAIPIAKVPTAGIRGDRGCRPNDSVGGLGAWPQMTWWKAAWLTTMWPAQRTDKKGGQPRRLSASRHLAVSSDSGKELEQSVDEHSPSERGDKTRYVGCRRRPGSKSKVKSATGGGGTFLGELGDPLAVRGHRDPCHRRRAQRLRTDPRGTGAGRGGGGQRMPLPPARGRALVPWWAACGPSNRRTGGGRVRGLWGCTQRRAHPLPIPRPESNGAERSEGGGWHGTAPEGPRAGCRSGVHPVVWWDRILSDPIGPGRPDFIPAVGHRSSGDPVAERGGEGGGDLVVTAVAGDHEDGAPDLLVVGPQGHVHLEGRCGARAPPPPRGDSFPGGWSTGYHAGGVRGIGRWGMGPPPGSRPPKWILWGSPRWRGAASPGLRNRGGGDVPQLATPPPRPPPQRCDPAGGKDAPAPERSLALDLRHIMRHIYNRDWGGRWVCGLGGGPPRG